MNGQDLPTSNAIDTSGDLSRTHDRSQSRAKVGAPLGGKPYKPNVRNQHESESTNTYPWKCALVLGTLNQSGGTEYRIGTFSGREQMFEGLCRSVNPDERTSPLELKRHVALACFGKSEIYSDRGVALKAARREYPQNDGIKVMVHPCSFPA